MEFACKVSMMKRYRGFDVPIILRLVRVMADRKISLNELARQVGMSQVNISKLKTGNVKTGLDSYDNDKFLSAEQVLSVCFFKRV